MKFQFLFAVFLLVLSSAQGKEKSPDSAIVDGQVFLNRGDFSEAEKSFSSVITQPESRREATLGLANALSGQGKKEEAVQVLSAYLDHMPVDVSARMQLADIYLAQGKPGLAQTELDRVRVLKPKQPGLEEKAALALLGLGLKGEAEKKLERVRALGQLSKSSFMLLAQLYIDRQQFTQAEAVLKDFETKSPPNMEYFLTRASVLEAQKKNKEAEDSYRRAIQIGDRSIRSWLAYGTFLNGQKRFSESLKVLKSARALDLKSTQALMLLAEAWEGAGDFVRAAAAYRVTLAITPGYDPAMFNLVRIEESRGSMDVVGFHLKEWSEKFPEKSWATLSYARILMAIGQSTKAREVLISNLGKVPDQADVQAYLNQLSGAPTAVSVASSEGKEPKEKAKQMAKKAKAAEASAVSHAPSRQPASIAVRTHVVTRGEVLSVISTKEYGTSKHWQAIFDANKEQLKSPEALEPGMVLKIPVLDPEASLPRERSFLSAMAQKGLQLFVSLSSMLVPEARAEESLLVRPEPRKASPRAVPAQSPASAVQIPEVESIEADGDDLVAPPPVPETGGPSRIVLSVSGAPVYEQYKLDGGGFSSSLPAKLGYLFGAELGYKLANFPAVISLRGALSRTKFTGLPGVVPTIIQLDRKRFAFLCSYNPSGTGRGLNFTLGYGFQQRNVEETTPRAVVTSVRARGPILGIGFESEVNRAVKWENKLELSFPHGREETGASRTGNFKAAMGAEMRSGLSQRLSASVEAAISLQVHFEQASFEGTGSRGTVNASEKEWSFSLPVEVRF